MSSTTYPLQSSSTRSSTTHSPQSSFTTSSTISTTATTLHNGRHDLYVIPWHGITSNGLHLANTGPLDNWKMIIQYLVKSHEIDLDQLNEQSGNVIKTALMLVENRQYADAKFVFLSTNSIIRNGVIDFYGYEADYFIPLFHLILTTEVTTSCSLSTCSCINTYKTYTQSQVVCHINVVFKVDWLYPKPNHFYFFC